MGPMRNVAWLALALGCLGAVGCGSTRDFEYTISVICTEPTGPTDKPGIWFHEERESAKRPLPRPIPRAVLTLYAVPPEGEPYQLGYSERTSEDGIGRLLGHAEIGKKDSLRLQAVKEGYRPEQRDFEPEQLRLADLAVVLAPVGEGGTTETQPPAAEAPEAPTGGPSGAAGGENEPAPTEATAGPAAGSTETGGGEDVLAHKRKQLLATIERLEKLDAQLGERLPADHADRVRLREQIEKLQALVKKLEELGAK